VFAGLIVDFCRLASDGGFILEQAVNWASVSSTGVLPEF
jgi:hypothetical protein